MTDGIGSASRLLIDTATPDSGSFWAEFISESVVQNEGFLNSNGLRGTRSRASERNRGGNETVSGTINMEASRLLLDNILPGVLGATESTNVFDVDEDIPDMYLLMDKLSDIVLISEAKFGKLTLSGSQNQIVQVALDIEAETMTGGQSWPSGPAPDVSNPYFFSDLGNVTLLSTARKIIDFSISIDNVLVADQFYNQLTRDETIQPSDRIVQVNLTVPATTANSDLMDRGAVEGAAVQLVFTNADEASSVLTIDLGRVSFNASTPTINGKGQQVIPLTGEAKAIGHAGATAPDIKFTNAHAA